MPVDGAIIASPTGLHLTHARFAAARGWDLLIEKPVAGTMAEANALVTNTREVATLGRASPALSRLGRSA